MLATLCYAVPVTRSPDRDTATMGEDTVSRYTNTVDHAACGGCDDGLDVDARWTERAQTFLWDDATDTVPHAAHIGACGTSCHTVPPPPFDAEAAALLEAASYGFNNPEANDRLAAARARTIAPDVERLRARDPYWHDAYTEALRAEWVDAAWDAAEADDNRRGYR